MLEANAAVGDAEGQHREVPHHRVRESGELLEADEVSQQQRISTLLCCGRRGRQHTLVEVVVEREVEAQMITKKTQPS